MTHGQRLERRLRQHTLVNEAIQRGLASAAAHGHTRPYDVAIEVQVALELAGFAIKDRLKIITQRPLLEAV